MKTRKTAQPQTEFVCDACGKKFLAAPSQRTGKHVFCDVYCSGRGEPNYEPTLEEIERMKAKLRADHLARRRGEVPHFNYPGPARCAIPVRMKG